MTDLIRLEGSKTRAAFGLRPGIALLESLSDGSQLSGNPAQLSSQWTVYDPTQGICVTLADDAPGATCQRVQEEDGAVSWRVTLPVADGQLSAVIRARMQGDCVRFTLEDVAETPQAHLVTVRLNGLAAATQQDAASRLALPAHGGRLIDPAACQDGATDHRYNWILDSFGSAAIVYTRCLSAVVRIHLMDDQLTSRVGGAPGARYAQVGALFRRRYTKLDVSYRKAKPHDETPPPEDAARLPAEEDFLLPGTPCATVELIAHPPVTVESGWVPGACRVRDSLPGKRSDYYRDKMVYKIFVGAPGLPVQTNLDQIRALVFDLARRTGNAGQLPYLVGFQHQGHDTGYPDVFTLNPALQSVEALQRLVEDARGVNCHISFHDNFDDAYASSPSWCADDIARDHTGHLLRGGVWNGVQAYWNGMPYYARHKAEERIRRTVEAYPFLRDTYHLDVLTASVFRVDFRGGAPAGRQADLEGRLEIVERFRRHGLDVSSEACGLPFVGSISYFWHMQRVARPLYAGDRRIPMVPFLVHGKADYAGTHTDAMRDILDGLLYGGFYCNDVTAATPIKQLTDAYFMLQYPLNLLRDDLAVDYAEDNGWKTVRYASGAEIAVAFESEECRVTIGGQRLIENSSAMLPQPDGSTLLYRCHEEPYTDVRWATGLPAGTRLTATPLGVALPSRTLVVESDGCVPVDTDLGIAYRVRREEA